MPYVWMDEVPRVQTVGANGIGDTPAVPVEEVQKISGTGREMKKNGKENAIPNPETATSGKVLKVSDGQWEVGTDKDSLPDPSTANEGDVLTVSSGAWTAVAPSGGGSSALLVGYSEEIGGALDKTWKEIHDAAPLVWIDDDGVYYSFLYYGEYSGTYYCGFMRIDNNVFIADTYATDSENGYPVYQENNG